MKISVCICTYNRSQSLARTLDSLSIPTGDAASTEVLIVDNNCTDGTAQVVESFRNKLPILRVLETLQGLAHARNRAVAEFRGDLLLFTDDDVRLEAGWLAAYLEASRRFPEAQLGLNDELRHEQPASLVKHLGKGFGWRIWQYPNQFPKYLVFLSSITPPLSSYAEIGCDLSPGISSKNG
jgi:glycosyltransferase involved in cell wall biosynthesis